MRPRTDKTRTKIEPVVTRQESDSVKNIQFNKDGAANIGRIHETPGDKAVLYVFGAGGGLGGPAGGMYERMAVKFQPLGVTSLQLDYRRPGYFEDCVDDVLSGIVYLSSLEKTDVVLVGHSFGGAVVIRSGIQSDEVSAVAALSSQTVGAENVAELSPKPLLLIHGTDDEVLPHSCSMYLYREDLEPKEMILYEGCRHGLDQCRDDLDKAMTSWLTEVLGLDRQA
jgi:alpha/beta superfamily hydrolase